MVVIKSIHDLFSFSIKNVVVTLTRLVQVDLAPVEVEALLRHVALGLHPHKLAEDFTKFLLVDEAGVVGVVLVELVAQLLGVGQRDTALPGEAGEDDSFSLMSCT